MRVLIDTNIFLDAFLDRKPFSDDARTLFELIESGEVQGYVSATTVTDIFYISKKAKGTSIAKQAVQRILASLEICAVKRASKPTLYQPSCSPVTEVLEPLGIPRITLPFGAVLTLTKVSFGS